MLNLRNYSWFYAQVDPMFRKTAASFDECSTAGVFLTTLHTHSYLSEILFDSMVTPLPSSETPKLPSSSHVKMADLKGRRQQLPAPLCSLLVLVVNDSVCFFF